MLIGVRGIWDQKINRFDASNTKMIDCPPAAKFVTLRPDERRLGSSGARLAHRWRKRISAARERGHEQRCLEAASKMFASPSEPDAARPDLACQILHAILPEGLHKKNGSWALSRAQVAREASEGRPLKLGCAICCRARILGKPICGLKFCDGPALAKMYSRGSPIHPK